MAISLISGSAVTLVTGTETTLTNVGSNGLFQLVVDTSNMATGDGVEIRSKQMVTPTGTTRVVEYQAYYGAQLSDDYIKVTTPLPNDQTDANALLFTLKQTYGTGRSFSWKVLNLAAEPTNYMMLGIDASGRIQNVGNVTGAVTVGTINSPQTFNLIGNITGTITTVIGLTSGSDPWATAIPASYVTGTAGYVLGNTAALADMWGYSTANLTGSSSIGLLLNTDIDSKISSRMPSGTITVGTVTAVQGGYVSVSGLTPSYLDTYVSSRIPSGVVTVGANNDKTGYSLAGNVTVGTNLDKTGYSISSNSDKSGYSLAAGQQVISTAVQGGYVAVSGTVNGAGLTPAYLDTYVSSRMASGAVTLSSPQSFNMIGNISGTVSTVINLVSGTSGGGGATPAQVWSYGTRTLTNITGVSIDPTAVWNFSTRTLTSPTMSNPQPLTGNTITLIQGNTMSIPFIGLGSLASLQYIYFTVKRSLSDIDPAAIIQIEKSAGLITLNASPAAIPSDGQIVVSDAVNGNITISLQTTETQQLNPMTDIFYDVVLVRNDNSVTTLVSGNFTVLGSPTRSP